MTNSEVTPSAIMAERRLLFQKVAKIFLPFSQEKSKKLYPQGELNPPVPFVHYTSAESALSILKNKRFWMRNTQCMADFREVQYGHDMFFDAFNRNDGKLRSELIAAIDDCSPKAADAAIEQFDKNWPSIQRATYVTCLSEHDESEDQHGRLSMWRAFAPNSARVAIVLRIPHFSPVTEKLRLMFSPVGYLNQASVDRELERVIKGIRENAEFLRWEVSPDVLYGFIYTMLLAGVTCLKHEGFHEEREWRAIYCPLVLPGPADILKDDLKVIAGIPQKVYELPMCSSLSADLADIDLAKILDRVILGPTQYSLPMYDAFVDALTILGVPDPVKRVAVSGIPIRT